MPKPDTSPTNSGKREPTDLAILRHVALYGLTFTHPVQKLFFPAENFDRMDHALRRAGDALHGLSGDGLLTSKDGKRELRFNKDYKYYIITRRGAKLAGVDYSPPSSNPNKDLAILWACVMEKKRFHRLTSRDVAEQIPKHTPRHNIPHILAEEEYDQGKSTCVIYRAYVTGSAAKDAVKYVKKHYAESCQNESLRPLVETGDYGFAILVPTDDRRREVQKLLSAADGEKSPLNRVARFTVRLGPTHATLREAIDSLPS